MSRQDLQSGHTIPLRPRCLHASHLRDATPHERHHEPETVNRCSRTRIRALCPPAPRSHRIHLKTRLLTAAPTTSMEAVVHIIILALWVPRIKYRLVGWLLLTPAPQIDPSAHKSASRSPSPTWVTNCQRIHPLYSVVGALSEATVPFPPTTKYPLPGILIGWTRNTHSPRYRRVLRGRRR